MANEKKITIPLRAAKDHARKNRSTKALTELRRQLFKHFRRKPDSIRLSQGLNQRLWARGREKPPARLELKVVEEDELLRVYLADEKIEAPAKKEKKGPKAEKESAEEIKVEKEKAAADEKKLGEKREKEKMMAGLER